MTNEYCPRCHSVTNMIVSIVEKEEKDEKGNKLKIITSSYQCDRCNTFVRSEDRKIPIKFK